MPNSIAEDFRVRIGELHAALLAIPADSAGVPWREGGWTGREILGHMLDSAANNRQRWVRAGIEGSYRGPVYAQKEWVAAHGYSRQSWATLLRWWQAEHEILIGIVESLPEERLQARCIVGDNDPVTLRYLIEDYIVHQRGHLDQIALCAGTR